jgi:hypothetical protein
VDDLGDIVDPRAIPVPPCEEYCKQEPSLDDLARLTGLIAVSLSYTSHPALEQTII